MKELSTWAWFGVVDHVARFELRDPAGHTATGFGLHEHGLFGSFPKYGL